MSKYVVGAAALVALMPSVAARPALKLVGRGECIGEGMSHPTWITSYAERPHGKDVNTLLGCIADCEKESECTGLGYSSAFKKCVLYKGGPYTKSQYWSMYTDFECHAAQEDDEL
eukprot:TRINITY_DN127330_c0_g1_i1.p1 TRINITY_DN127330_c0_g1~~TRINITY_DN127330_c0_g1_i1.p1  ORF type:complete len:115 (+),score=21.94 TRINITY_DN127330_c0_g1_i1:56-400(+)